MRNETTRSLRSDELGRGGNQRNGFLARAVRAIRAGGNGGKHRHGAASVFSEFGDWRSAGEKERNEPDAKFSGCAGDDFSRGVLFVPEILPLNENRKGKL